MLHFISKTWLETLCFITAEEKKEPTTDSKKKEEKNDSDSEDEGKKERQRFKSERPKEQHKFEKQEQSMWKKWMNGCSKSVSPFYSSLEVVDNPHIMKVYFTNWCRYNICCESENQLFDH